MTVDVPPETVKKALQLFVYLGSSLGMQVLVEIGFISTS
jgi:hypothetical protein